MTPLVEIRHVEKLAPERAIFHDLSLTLERGRFYALVGKSGSGKSTLMRLLMRYEMPDRGEISLFGSPATRPNGGSEPNERIGYVSEHYGYSVPASLRDLFRTQGSLYPRWDAGLFERMIQDFRLNGRSSLPELSRAQRVKLAFAGALAMKPSLLLFDQVTALLDDAAWSYCLRALEGFVASGGTVLMATRLAAELEHYATDLLVLDEGYIKFQTTVERLNQAFTKLRRPAGLKHALFDDERCIGLTRFRDGSSLVIVPTPLLGCLDDKMLAHLDRETVTFEDIVTCVLGRGAYGRTKPC